MVPSIDLCDTFDHDDVAAVSVAPDPHPEKSAKYAWGQIAQSILAAWPSKAPFSRESVLNIHSALYGIRGSLLKPKSATCDACDFLIALSVLGQFGKLPYLCGKGGSIISNYDLIEVFSGCSTITDDDLALRFSPREREIALHSIRRAPERIQWLKLVIDGKNPASDGMSIGNCPAITLKELDIEARKIFGKNISVSTIRNIMKRYGVQCEKRTYDGIMTNCYLKEDAVSALGEHYKKSLK